MSKDRFKEKERETTSLYEEELIKKIAARKSTSQPPKPVKKATEEDELVDLWSNEDKNKEVNRNLGKFKNFLERS